MQQNDVMIAFDILLEEIETVIENFNENGAEAFQRSDYDSVNEIKDKASHAASFRDKVKALQKEWKQFFTERVADTLQTKPKKQSVVQRLQRDLRTPEDAFRQPILEALVELDGSATLGDTLDRVYEKIKDRLNEYDHQTLTSTPHNTRWRNTAQRCRNTSVKEGLMSDNSPRGIWEITDAGREELSGIKNDNND